MELIVWRHAEAEDGAAGGDLARRLTARGERQAEKIAAWLNERLDAKTRILASPAARTQATAQALGRPVETIAALAPGAAPEDVLDAAGWPDADSPVLVVGHQPTLGLAVSLALSGTAQHWSVKKAGVWWLRWKAGEVTVVAVQAPDTL